MHVAAHGLRNFEALHNDGVQRLAAQIEEAILQAEIFRVVGFAEDGDGQFLGFGEDFDLGGIDFDRAGCELGVGRAVGALAHLAIDADDPLGAQFFGHLEGRAVGIGDDLGQAVMVAQVDEEHAAVVADAVDPAR